MSGNALKKGLACTAKATSWQYTCDQEQWFISNSINSCRKAVRATFVLVPLFGMHFMVTLYRPTSGDLTCAWISAYYYVNDLLDGLQGGLVALIFCYANGEVRNSNSITHFPNMTIFLREHYWKLQNISTTNIILNSFQEEINLVSWNQGFL